MNDEALIARPRVIPPLDVEFRPAILANRKFRAAAEASGTPGLLQIALERSDGSVSHHETEILPEDHPNAGSNFRFVERLLKFLLWSRGGYKVHIAGSPEICARLQQHYHQSPTGKFDAWIMGEKIYEKPFEVLLASPENLPAANELTAPLGRHLDGCRIGFDLGASDRKAAAVIDGKVVFTEEVPWDPRAHSDPQWHFDQIMDSLKRAAAHLPRVDAIGASSAGVYVNNRVKVASLFRGVYEELFNQRVKDLFLELKRAWNNIPFEVVNDGEVTALAGAMALQANAVLGLALGSSQAAGYVTPQGNITSWLNELAFAPVDYNLAATVDEWSGDYGCGVQYFSQQAVSRLLPASGLAIDPKLPLPEKLVEVQSRMAQGDERAAKIYETIGVYLGYTIAHYKEFYDFHHLLVLGRVTTGQGGQIIVDHARDVLRKEFPELRAQLHLPDEKEKRHGQAIAAASLPVIDARPSLQAMNPYQKFVADLANLQREAKSLPLGGLKPSPSPKAPANGPKGLIFSPHPDDEVIIGGLPLRLLREAGFEIFNVAVTQGSNKARQAERWKELTVCCEHIGFGLLQTRPNGLEGINLKARDAEPAQWQQSVQRIAEILREHSPHVIFFPHDRDWNSSHIGTHHLVLEALQSLGPDFQCFSVETEFWGAMDTPNLMVESTEQDVVDLISALSFHVGEVRRNPYHLRMPAWLMDNVRRGGELVGGQGGAAPNFLFATLYRLRRWCNGQFETVLSSGRFLAASENPANLFRT